MARNAAISVRDTPGSGDALRIGPWRGSQTGEVETRGDTANDRPLSIGEVAREFGVTLRALRFYETKRLVVPLRHGATRLYRRSDRERLTLILTGRRLGFTLAEIKQLLDRPQTGLHLTREQCVTQINLLEQQKRGLEIAIAELRQIYTSFYRKRLEEAGGHFP